jgi:ABC-type transport system substrate-binding protein
MDYSAGSVGRKEAIEALGQYWGKLGIKVEGNPVDLIQFNKKGVNNEYSPVMILAQYSVPTNNPVFALSTTTTNGGKAQRFKNDQAEQLYQQLLAEIDPAKRSELLKQVEKALREDFAYIPLYYGWDMFASSTKINGFTPSPNQTMRFDQVTKA